MRDRPTQIRLEFSEEDEDLWETSVSVVSRIDESLREIPVGQLPLPARTISALKRAGIGTVGQLASACDSHELPQVRGLGRNSLFAISAALHDTESLSRLGSEIRRDAPKEHGRKVDSMHAYMAQLEMDDREWLVLEERVDSALTLAEVGALLELTRERIRQIQKRAASKLLERIDRLTRLFEVLAGSSVRLWKPFDRSVGRKEASYRVTATLTRLGWVEADAALSSRLLLVVRTICSEYDSRALAKWPMLTLMACALEPTVDSHPGVAEELTRVERARRRTTLDCVQAVLIAANSPMHWRDIVEQATGSCGLTVSTGTIYNLLLRRSDVFVRTAGGTYALVAWGNQEVQTYVDLVAEAMREEERPLTYGSLFSYVNTRRAVGESSLHMLLDLNPRFYKSIESTYGLRAWLPERERQTLRTPRAFRETNDSFARVERAINRGYNVDLLVELDRNGSKPTGQLS